MNFATALQHAEKILKDQNVKSKQRLDVQSFPSYAKLVATAAKDFTQKQREFRPWLMEWAETWRKLYDNFDKTVKADPMLLYKPLNHAAESFHKSKAYIRYFRAGNRSSKSQSAFAEHYFILTGQHPYRYFPPAPNSTFLVSLNFTDYLSGVFNRKMFGTEEDNPLAPMFPKDGKWFYHWHDRNHILTIACPECASKGKAGSCRHPKSTMKLFSAEAGVGVMEGFVARMAHIDEHVPEEFFQAVKQRIQSASYSSLIVTGTPLHGMEAWETRKLAMVAEGPPHENRIIPEDPKSPPLISIHQVSQFDAGVIPKWKVKASMQDMDEFEIASRIYGRPSPLAKNPVFDRHVLADMQRNAVKAIRGSLEIANNAGAPMAIEEILFQSEVEFQEAEDGPCRIWEKPELGAQYIIGADSAAGLAAGDGRTKPGDPSCASVLKLVAKKTGKIGLELVAQYHTWVNVLDYADELKKLGIYYNNATVVIELTGGHGRATMLRLRRELYYSYIFLDTNAPEMAEPGISGRLGVETNASTKPMMVGALQQAIRNQVLKVLCSDTIQELTAFEQEKSERGFTVHYRGAGGSHDDRVMSLVIAVYVAVTHPVYQFFTVQETSKQLSEFAQIREDLQQNAKEDPFR